MEGRELTSVDLQKLSLNPKGALRCLAVHPLYSANFLFAIGMALTKTEN